jgi:1A family penicillin-binding protein
MRDPHKTIKLFDPVEAPHDAAQWQPLSGAPLPPARRRSPRGWRDLVLRGVLLGLVTLAFLGLLGAATVLGIYGYYARQLPSPEELYSRTTSFKSTKLFDRRGRLLYEIIDPLGGRRIIVRFGDLPSVLIEATIATEDPTFFTNLGVSPTGIARALYEDLRHGDRGQGGSTITQQLVKNLFLTPERTYKRKIQEAILSAEITRRYSKAEILEVYLNEVYLGNLAYGVGAAAETYFGKPVAQLDLAEASLLVGLIQSPAIYDPYVNPEAAMVRRGQILGLMLRRGYITRQEFDAAMAAPLALKPQEIVMQAPHMVTTVREELERLYGTEMLYKGGLQVYTTLDLSLQHEAEAAAREGVLSADGTLASNAALVAIDPRNGEVLALLGSVDFYNPAISGQVNMARNPRQPGSTIKPFTYLAALERGWTAGTMIMDLEQSFPDGANPPYKPQNYDDQFWGPVSLRTALANSRNIPAVSTLNQIGLPALLEVCQRLGIRSLTRQDYGLSLTLGGGEVTLLEMTAAYGALANGGRRVAPQLILRIEDQAGKVLWQRPAPELPQVMDARHAYILTDILADQAARQRTFGESSALDLPFAAAAKTGTTNDYRDAWTMGYTPELVTGVWVGNSDNTPLERLSGARAAAPIWHAFMVQALANADHPAFARPDGLVEVQVCPIAGLRHTDLCPPARSELFLREAGPAACTVHSLVTVCQVTGKLATAFCPTESVEQRRVDDYGAAWDDWAHAQGFQTPPRATCDLHSTLSRVSIELPSAPLAGIVTLRGTTEVADFQSYHVEYGKGHDPQGWKAISPEIKVPVFDGALCQWDTRALHNGDYALRLVVRDSHGHSYQARALTSVHNAEPPATASSVPSETLSPTATPTETLAPTDTPAATATATQVPTATALPSATPSRTPLYTLTPTRTATPRPSETPMPTASATSALTETPLPTATQTPTATPTAESYPPALATPASTRAPEGYPGAWSVGHMGWISLPWRS